MMHTHLDTTKESLSRRCVNRPRCKNWTSNGSGMCGRCLTMAELTKTKGVDVSLRGAMKAK